MTFIRAPAAHVCVIAGAAPVAAAGAARRGRQRVENFHVRAAHVSVSATA